MWNSEFSAAKPLRLRVKLDRKSSHLLSFQIYVTNDEDSLTTVSQIRFLVSYKSYTGTSVSHNLAIKPMYYLDLVVLAMLNLQVTFLREASVCQLRVTLPSKKLATLVGPTTSTAERR